MKSLFTYCICLSMLMLTTALSAQEKMKIKDANGNVLLEARKDGVLIPKMTTAERIAVPGLTQDDNGLMVYDKDTKSLWIWHDTAWLQIDGVDLVDDADHDPTNELQTWTTLPGIPAGFADGDDNVNDADADPTNELQTWTTLPGIPAGFADGVDNVNDADADPANERNQSMILDGTTLKITDSGGTLSTNLSSLTNNGAWIKVGNKVYNTTDNIGIGTNDPQAPLNIVSNKGLDQYVMMIENQNHEGSGLKIKIDGSHPTYVQGAGNDPDFFITRPVTAIGTILEDVAGDIRDYLLSEQGFNLGDFSLANFANCGLLDSFHLRDFITGGICKGASSMVETVNSSLLAPLQLPDLPLDGIPMDIPNIPALPTIPTVAPFTFNIPDFNLWIPFPVSDYVTISTPNPSFPVSTINTPITNFNTNIAPVNSGITNVNNTLESGYDQLKSALQMVDNWEIPLPQLQVPTTIGPITCPENNVWDNFNIVWDKLNPLDYNILNPLSTDNNFISFVDAYDNRVGAITGQNIGEFNLAYFKLEKVLNIGSYICGMFAVDGGVVKNGIKLAKEAYSFYKSFDKIGVVYSSGHGDYAEWLERADHDEVLGYGDIVGIKGGKISLSIDGAEQVTVVSQAPIVLGNTPEPGNEENGNNVAFIGQVPVKVMGPVRSGDYIVANPSMAGYGLAVPENEITAAQLVLAVGKSWETNSSPGFKFVNTIVGMHNNGWAVPVMKLQQQVKDHETALEQLSARVDQLEMNGSMAEHSKKSKS